jgi:hypothetical protein
MRRSILVVATIICGPIVGVSASAATSTRALVKRPQLVIAQATQFDGTSYPLKGGEALFSLQLTRGGTVTGGKAAPGNANGFTPVANWSTGKARPLHVKLRVGDTLMVCWQSGTLHVALSRMCETHTFVKADRAAPYTYSFDLVKLPPIRFE